jgi:hypothetical protein
VADEPGTEIILESTANGVDALTRLALESKEDMRRRGALSPDEWDAVALTFARRWRRRRAGSTASWSIRGSAGGGRSLRPGRLPAPCA